MTLLLIIISTLIISLLSLIGIFSIGMKEERVQKILFLLVSLATGSLIGGSLLHLLPEALEVDENSVNNLIFGILLFLVLEKFLFWRHCHKEKCDVHSFTYMNLIGDGLHNFIDGIIVAISFITDIRLGIVSSFAIALHEIPQELGDFGVLVYGGFSIRKALFFNLLSALTCTLGGVITYFLGPYLLTIKPLLLSITAGGFIYIALVDLLPELRKKAGMRESVVQLIFIIFGILIMWGTKFLHLE